MKECTLHRDATVRYGPFHDRCPLCKVIERASEAKRAAGLHYLSSGIPDPHDLCIESELVDDITEGVADA